MARQSDVLPLNVEAERYVLGSLLLDDSMAGAVFESLSSADLGVEVNRRIFAAMQALYERGARIDRVTVATELERSSSLDSVGGLGYLVSLDEGMPQLGNVDSYVQIVQEKALLRRLLAACWTVEANVNAGGDAQAVLDLARESLLGLQPPTKGTGPTSVADLVAQNNLDHLLSPVRAHGVQLPWLHLDRLLSGLHAGQLVVLAGHTGTGKTSLALQVAAAAAEHTGVLYFSLEMDPPRLFRRLVAQRAAVDGDQLRRGALSAEDRRRAVVAAQELAGRRLWLDDRTSTVPGIVSGVRRLRLSHNVGLVVVDYLQLLRGVGRYESRAKEVGAQSRALKLAAQEFSVPFVVLSQFSRESAKTRRPPELYDLKESGDIENDADVVLLLRPDLAQTGGENPRRVEIYVAKQREGRSHQHVQMAFRTHCQSFEERT